MQNKLKIFSGRSNVALGEKLVQTLGCKLGEISIRTFSDGELWVKFEENIRGHDVFLIQSTNGPSENIIELALMVDAAIRASANRVTVLMPYFGYGRQDRKDQPRVPISSRAMIDIFTVMGSDRIVTMDLHSTQIQGFAKIPFDNLYSRTVLLDAILSQGINPETGVVLAPDIGSAKMSQSYAKHLGMHFALIDKRRYAPNQAEVSHLIGDLENMDVLIIDDMIDTAGTICNAADTAIARGAKSVTAMATHPVLSGPAIERLVNSKLSKVIVADTIELNKEKVFDKLEIISVQDVFADAIKHIVDGTSLSSMFKI